MVIVGESEDDIFELIEGCVVEEVCLNHEHTPNVGVVVMATRDGLDDLIDTARERRLKVGRYPNPVKATEMLHVALGLRPRSTPSG